MDSILNNSVLQKDLQNYIDSQNDKGQEERSELITHWCIEGDQVERREQREQVNPVCPPETTYLIAAAFSDYGKIIDKLYRENAEELTHFIKRAAQLLIVKTAPYSKLLQCLQAAALYMNMAEREKKKESKPSYADELMLTTSNEFLNYLELLKGGTQANIYGYNIEKLTPFRMSALAGISLCSLPAINQVAAEHNNPDLIRRTQLTTEMLLNGYGQTRYELSMTPYMNQEKMPLPSTNKNWEKYEQLIRKKLPQRDNAKNLIKGIILASEDMEYAQISYETLSEVLLRQNVQLAQLELDYRLTNEDMNQIADTIYRFEPNFIGIDNYEETLFIPLVIATVLAKEIDNLRKHETKHIVESLIGERKAPVHKKNKYRNEKKLLEKKNRATHEKIDNLITENARLKKEYKEGIEQENRTLIRELEKSRKDMIKLRDRADDAEAELTELREKLSQLQDQVESMIPEEEIEVIYDERHFVLMSVSDEYAAGLKTHFFPNMTYTNKPVIPGGVKKPVVVTMFLTNHKTTQYLKAANVNTYRLWTKHKARAAVEIRDFLDSLEKIDE